MNKFITVFLVMIGGTVGALLFSKSGDSPNFPRVPVPFKPDHADSGVVAYRYRGLYIGLYAVPDQGYRTKIFGTKNFLVEPVAINDEVMTDSGAIGAAMEWIDIFRDGALA